MPLLAALLFVAQMLPGSLAACGRLAVPAAQAADPVTVVIGLRWRNQAELDEVLREIANPQSARFGQHLSASEFDRRFGPSTETIQAVTELLSAQGLTVTELSPSRLFISATGWVEDPARTRTWLIQQVRNVTNEDRIYCDVASGGSETRTGAAVTAHAAGSLGPALRSPLRGPLLPPQSGNFYAPTDIERAYGFQHLNGQAGAGSRRETTIAIATAFGFDWTDVEAFWQEANIARGPDSVEMIPVGGQTREVHAETTIDLEWASALAPHSRILVYAGPDAAAETFLKVYDRIVSDNRAAIVSTSWGTCEDHFGHTYLEQAHTIFQRAAAQGITFLAASGDNGAYDCGDGSLAVNFPASDPYVLAVGGSSLAPDGRPERAWRGSGGGVSRKWPAPPWQMRSEVNRVLPDVAFHADPARGFIATVAGLPSIFGGTSIAAPCWAALIALINDLRAARGRSALGLAAPELCEVAMSAEQAPQAFHDIVSGDNAGYTAGPGWDFTTGWGSPRALGLAQALSDWSPPPFGPGDVRQTQLLASTDPSGNGSARLLFSRRCARTNVRLQLRYAPAGTYRLNFDGIPVASLSTDANRPLWLDLPHIDPRGHQVTLTSDEDGHVRFRGAFPLSPSSPLRLRLTMTSTGLIEAASGAVLYRVVRGRERFSVRVRNLPAGTYTVRLGNQAIGSFTLVAGRDSARISFDSSGVSAAPLPLSPLCESVTVSRNSLPILTAARIGRAGEPCRR